MAEIHIENLKRYIKDDTIYQSWKKGKTDVSDFDMFCIDHCKDIEALINENQELKAEYGTKTQVERDLLRIEVSARETCFNEVYNRLEKIRFYLETYTDLNKVREEMLNILKMGEK